MRVLREIPAMFALTSHTTNAKANKTQTQMHRPVDYMPHGEKPIQHQAVDPSKDYSAQG